MDKHTVIDKLKYALDLAEDCQTFNGGEGTDGDVEIRGAIILAIDYINELPTQPSKIDECISELTENFNYKTDDQLQELIKPLIKFYNSNK